MRVQLIAKPSTAMTGTARYNVCLLQAFEAAGFEARLTFPDSVPLPASLRRGLKQAGIDVEAFFANYPVRARLETAAIHHLTSQTLATMLLCQRLPRPVVVTVLDILPYLLRNDRRLKPFRHPVEYLFDRLAMIGLRRADVLVAISEYTKRTLVDELGIPSDRVHVTHLAVDHDRFRPLTVPEAFRRKYDLHVGQCYVLYVGSEDPRKNLASLIGAFGLVRQRARNVKLLKVGTPHFIQERVRLTRMVAENGLGDDVRFIDDVPDHELPFFYNAADVFVLPSLYEGFGLPVLEAMACGTPVVCTNATSLPELAGEAALLTAGDRRSLADAIQALLDDPARRIAQRQMGLQQAQRFTWAATARKTIDLYRLALEGRVSDDRQHAPLARAV